MWHGAGCPCHRRPYLMPPHEIFENEKNQKKTLKREPFHWALGRGTFAYASDLANNSRSCSYSSSSSSYFCSSSSACSWTTKAARWRFWRKHAAPSVRTPQIPNCWRQTLRSPQSSCPKAARQEAAAGWALGSWTAAAAATVHAINPRP